MDPQRESYLYCGEYVYEKNRSWMKLCANKGWLTVERPNLGIKAPFFGDRDFPNEMHIEIGDLRVNHV